jgi:hypothetical protein
MNEQLKLALFEPKGIPVSVVSVITEQLPPYIIIDANGQTIALFNSNSNNEQQSPSSTVKPIASYHYEQIQRGEDEYLQYIDLQVQDFTNGLHCSTFVLAESAMFHSVSIQQILSNISTSLFGYLQSQEFNSHVEWELTISLIVMRNDSTCHDLLNKYRTVEFSAHELRGSTILAKRLPIHTIHELIHILDGISTETYDEENVLLAEFELLQQHHNEEESKRREHYDEDGNVVHEEGHVPDLDTRIAFSQWKVFKIGGLEQMRAENESHTIQQIVNGQTVFKYLLVLRLMTTSKATADYTMAPGTIKPYVNSSYSSSVLCSLCEDALGGNCKTVVICHMTKDSIENNPAYLNLTQQLSLIRQFPLLNDDYLIGNLQRFRRMLSTKQYSLPSNSQQHHYNNTKSANYQKQGRQHTFMQDDPIDNYMEHVKNLEEKIVKDAIAHTKLVQKHAQCQTTILTLKAQLRTHLESKAALHQQLQESEKSRLDVSRNLVNNKMKEQEWKKRFQLLEPQLNQLLSIQETKEDVTRQLEAQRIENRKLSQELDDLKIQLVKLIQYKKHVEENGGGIGSSIPHISRNNAYQHVIDPPKSRSPSIHTNNSNNMAQPMMQQQQQQQPPQTIIQERIVLKSRGETVALKKKVKQLESQLGQEREKNSALSKDIRLLTSQLEIAKKLTESYENKEQEESQVRLLEIELAQFRTRTFMAEATVERLEQAMQETVAKYERKLKILKKKAIKQQL